MIGSSSRVVVDSDRLLRDLETIVGPRRVSMRHVDLETYARDMWPRLLLSYREGTPPAHRPHAVVWPEHIREIVAIVKLARELRIPIVPYGGGSGVCGGALPLFGGITIDTKRMQAVRGVRGDELICDVEGGLSGERFERELASRGYTFGHFPSSICCSTVGGWLGDARRRPAVDEVRQGRGSRRRPDARHRARRDHRDRWSQSALRGPNWTQLILGKRRHCSA